MRILILPGTGADERMYRAWWHALPGARFLDWPDGEAPLPRSIPELAERLAKEVDQPPDLIVGTSLGGMVALELSDLLQVRDVVLVSSATSHREVRSGWRILAVLLPVFPFGLLRRIAAHSERNLLRMYADQDPVFIRTLLGAILQWEYRGTARIHRLHGRRDPVLRASWADRWLDGGHLIALSREPDCVAALCRRFPGLVV